MGDDSPVNLFKSDKKIEEEAKDLEADDEPNIDFENSHAKLIPDEPEDSKSPIELAESDLLPSPNEDDLPLSHEDDLPSPHDNDDDD